MVASQSTKSLMSRYWFCGVLLALLAPVPLEAFHFSHSCIGVGQSIRSSQIRSRSASPFFTDDTSRGLVNHEKIQLICRRSTIVSVEDKTGEDLLTKQDLTIRMYEARDYYRQRPEEGMTQAAICLALLCTRLPDLRLNRCFVAPSTIAGAGNGVFASRDIAEGELVTLFPGDAVLIQDSNAEDSSAAPVGVMFGSHVKEADRDTSRVTSHEARSYEMEINTYTSIAGDPLIGAGDPAYLGHFANDGATLYEFDSASRETYTNATAARCNAANLVVEGAHMATVAIAAIGKGDEVFISYGAGYWLSRSLSESNSAENTGGVVQMDAAVPQGAGAGVILGNYIPRVGSSSASSPPEKPNRRARRSNKKKKGPKGNWKGF